MKKSEYTSFHIENYNLDNIHEIKLVKTYNTNLHAVYKLKEEGDKVINIPFKELSDFLSSKKTITYLEIDFNLGDLDDEECKSFLKTFKNKIILSLHIPQVNYSNNQTADLISALINNNSIYYLKIDIKYAYLDFKAKDKIISTLKDTNNIKAIDLEFERSTSNLVELIIKNSLSITHYRLYPFSCDEKYIIPSLVNVLKINKVIRNIEIYCFDESFEDSIKNLIKYNNIEQINIYYNPHYSSKKPISIYRNRDKQKLLGYENDLTQEVIKSEDQINFSNFEALAYGYLLYFKNMHDSQEVNGQKILNQDLLNSLIYKNIEKWRDKGFQKKFFPSNVSIVSLYHKRRFFLTNYTSRFLSIFNKTFSYHKDKLYDNLRTIFIYDSVNSVLNNFSFFCTLYPIVKGICKNGYNALDEDRTRIIPKQKNFNYFNPFNIIINCLFNNKLMKYTGTVISKLTSYDKSSNDEITSPLSSDIFFMHIVPHLVASEHPEFRQGFENDSLKQNHELSSKYSNGKNCIIL
ncbi:MAG: hypothetical protein J0H68_03590 [Sphingobacteriia bacterium]|nr:hypothetical protein [Sphingobacteriia bacterium]